ncbi:hypothetical protein AB9F35_35710, partial [Rhizobium leguminosarum]
MTLETSGGFTASARAKTGAPKMVATWFGFGHRVPMPTPTVEGCDFRTFLFLTPIIETDQRIAE